MASASIPAQPGETIAGKYQIERVIGVGGAGMVVAARHVVLNELVAIKFLLPGAAHNRTEVLRFEREAKSAVKLKNEHVCRVYDVGELDDGSPFIVLEYLEGQDLAQVLRECGPLPIRDVATYLLQVCEAVAEAHSLGIVHRDLKPANFFLTHLREGLPLVKVLDLGIAMHRFELEQVDTSLTVTRSLLGSPIYMSPEQVRNARTVDHRSDIWSLGVSLFELLTDHVPFSGHTVTAVAAAIATDCVPDIRVLRSDVPDELCGAIGRCLMKDPNDRYQNIAELAAALMPHAALDFGHLTRFSVGNLEASPSIDLGGKGRLPDSGKHVGDDRAGAQHREAVATPLRRDHEVARRVNELVETHPLQGAGGSPQVSADRHNSPPLRQQSPVIRGAPAIAAEAAGTLPVASSRQVSHRPTERPRRFRWLWLASAGSALVVFIGGVLVLLKVGAPGPSSTELRASLAKPGHQVQSCLDSEKMCEGRCVSRDRADHGCDSDSCAPCTTPNATPRCNSHGICDVALCHKGYEDCDGQRANGCEVDIRRDPDNCGACRQHCTEIANAERGCGDFCTIWRCNPGYRDCNEKLEDGCEVRVDRDNKNCGHCGTECAAGKQCREGICK